MPMQGVSMVYSFDALHAPDRHLTQYFEIIGNRADPPRRLAGGTVHKAPWNIVDKAAIEGLARQAEVTTPARRRPRG